jgi:hypothetical protein
MKWGLVRGFGLLGVFSECGCEVLASSFHSFIPGHDMRCFFFLTHSLPLLSVTTTNDWMLWSSHHGLEPAKQGANKSFDYWVLVKMREIITHYPR